jgi:hypothetical protein
MARNDEVEILIKEKEAVGLGYYVLKQLSESHIAELTPIGNQFHWIANHLREHLKEMSERTPAREMSERTLAQRKRLRQEISKRTKELSEAVKEKHIQHHLAFSCIDQHDECVRKRKKQKRSPYVCFLALFICLGSSMKGLIAAIAAAVAAGHLPEIF